MSGTKTERRPTLRELGQSLAVVAGALLERGVGLDEAVASFEAGYLRSAVERHRGNLSQAAAALGIHRNTLRTKLQRDGRGGRKGG
jgi:two-component system response regulator AauR